MRNKGFSLVELIIVIAIMAVLVGIMAPQLILYVNKTQVSADVQLCDSVKEVISIVMVEYDAKPTIDDVSQAQITKIRSGLPIILENYDATSPFAQDVITSLGLNPFGTINPNELFKSKVARGNGKLMCQFVGQEIIVWIDGSNSTGKHSPVYHCSDANSMVDEIVSSN